MEFSNSQRHLRSACHALRQTSFHETTHAKQGIPHLLHQEWSTYIDAFIPHVVFDAWEKASMITEKQSVSHVVILHTAPGSRCEEVIQQDPNQMGQKVDLGLRKGQMWQDICIQQIHGCIRSGRISRFERPLLVVLGNASGQRRQSFGTVLHCRRVLLGL